VNRSTNDEAKPIMAAHSDSRPSSPATDQYERAAIPPPMSEGRPRTQSKPDGKTDGKREMLEALSSITEKVKEGVSKEAIVDTVKKFATSILGNNKTENRPSDVAIGRFSMPARNSLSGSLDGYRPGRDVVAPISVRPNAMELLWVCGDCGQHYPRSVECPEECSCCGAPKQHFYAPIED
jgi:rubrerythrin